MRYLTLRRDWQSETIIEKSRFICSLKKETNEEEARAFINECKKTYWDAAHNCSAYILGINGNEQKSSDDGEPSGTAGVPMLGVLRKNQVTDVVAVVTRYFGGIKLGAGGLIRAYAGCVATALQTAGLAEKVLFGYYSLSTTVAEAGKVLNLLYMQDLFTVAGVEYTERAKITLYFPQETLAEVENWLNNALNAQINLEKEQVVYVERPIA